MRRGLIRQDVFGALHRRDGERDADTQIRPGGQKYGSRVTKALRKGEWLLCDLARHLGMPQATSCTTGAERAGCGPASCRCKVASGRYSPRAKNDDA